MSREGELAHRLLKFREHRARLLAANRQHLAAAEEAETRRRRLIARADHDSARSEAMRRPKRAYLKAPPAASG